MTEIRNEPLGSGPCCRQHVKATVIATDGRRHVGTNYCGTPQPACPRDGMPTGVGYHLCREVCRQPAHAEINAVLAAGLAARGAVLYLEGHFYACEPCKEFCAAAGVVEIVIGAPPAAP